jgi:hypothetical protein
MTMNLIPSPLVISTSSSGHGIFSLRVTVLVAVNGDKQPTGGESERAARLRRELPADWDNVSVAARAGLTVEFRRPRVTTTIRAEPGHAR